MQPLDITDIEHRLRTAIDAGSSVDIDHYGQLLDRLETDTVPNTLSAALWYASVGLHVFPLTPGAKIPHKGTQGCKDATLDPNVIRAWWEKWPDSNLAVATGHLVDVIDIDGPAGALTWARRMYAEDDTYDGPPILGVVDTPRPGGSHYYIATQGERGNRAGLLDHIDYRGIGGYVVAPPSVNAEGVRYTWRRPIRTEGAAA